MTSVSESIAAERLELVTLGGASLSRGGESLLGPGKLLALVSYLALTPGRSATREFLLDLLWADLARDRARHSLRQTIWQLRQVLGERILFGREELTLGIPIHSDRDRFLSAMEAGDPDAAIALYRGDFLPDFALPGSTGFEHWAEIERSRLRATFLRAAEMASRRRLAAGRYREAQDIARRMRDLDRLNETGWRLLLEAHIGGGNLIQAIAEAESLRSTLENEERDPEPATAALLTTLRRTPGEPAEPVAPEDATLLAELVGREQQFAAILDGWTQAGRGRSRHVHLSAPAGFGKSRLIGDAARRLRSIGARVVRVRANPADRSVPYGFAGDLAQALGSLPGLKAVSPATADVLVDLSPSLSSRLPNAKAPRSTGERLRLRTAALSEAVTVIAEEHPVALLVDDVHWLDPDSQQILAGLVHRLERVPVLVLTAGRSGLGGDVSSADSIEIALGPLSLTEVRLLFASLGRLVDDELLGQVARQLHHASGGSPLLVLETLQLALERNAISLLSDGTWSVPDRAALLAELDTGSAIRSRLAHLGPDGEWVLLLLATAGTPLATAELGREAGARDRLDDVLWTLERKCFVRRVAASWEPAHDEIAATIVAAAAPERRREAHRVVGRILLDRPEGRVADALQASRHFLAAGDDAMLLRGYHRAVELGRLTNDPRAVRDLARLATDGDEAAAGRLARTVALHRRLGFRSRARFIAAMAVPTLLLVAGLAWLRPSNPFVSDSASLMIIRNNDTDHGAVDLFRVRFERRSWRPGEPIAIPAPERTIRDSILRRVTTLDQSPGGTRWVYSATVDGDRAEDLFVREGDRSRILSAAVAGDDNPKWSPDGRQVVFGTARWPGARGAIYHLAVVNTATGAVRQLTVADDNDIAPAWAPHGGLIAFARFPHALRPREACLIRPDGRAERCVTSPIGQVSYVTGWLDDNRVLLQAEDDDGRVALVRWDVVSDRFELVTRVVGSAFWLSPDGRWIVCLCARDLEETVALLAFPVDDPGAVRKLGTMSFTALSWRPADRTAPVLGLRTRQRRIELAIGTEESPLAMVVDTSGERILLPRGMLRWTIRDSSIAEIDSVTGRIGARRAGRTTAVADFGATARDSLEVVVTSTSEAAVFAETWRRIDSTRWLEFGAPRPRLITTADGTRGFNNNGDGSYASGVFTRETLDPSGGLGIEARMSLPLNRSEWQHQTISVRSSRQLETDRWDRRTGAPRLDPRSINEECFFSYPAGIGVVAASRVGFLAGGVQRFVPVDSTWRAGGWHRIRIQLFPDGTCGFGLDGVPRWRSATRVPIDTPYRIWLSGNSVETNLVVGPVEVWRGVRPDIDWRTPVATPR